LNLRSPLGGGSTPLFIAWWGARVLLDQTNLTIGRDGSSEAVEEASRRGGQTLNAGGRPALGWGRPAPPTTCSPISPGVFWSLPESSSVVLPSQIRFVAN